MMPHGQLKLILKSSHIVAVSAGWNFAGGKLNYNEIIETVSKNCRVSRRLIDLVSVDDDMFYDLEEK